MRGITDLSSIYLKEEHYDYYGRYNFSLYYLGNVSLEVLLSLGRDSVPNRIWPYFFWITFTVGLIGNGLVITVYCKSRKMRTVTNTYLLNLSIVDILYLVSTIPYNSAWIEEWPLGGFMCKLLGYLMNVTTMLGTLTLTAVGIDRHNVIVYPISSRTHRPIGKTIIVIVTMWLISSAVSFPSFIIAQNIEMIGHAVCMYSWREKSIHQVYSLSTFMLFYAIPQIILCACYFRISTKLWFSVPTTSATNGAVLRKLKNGRRVVKMAAIVTVSFVVCWLPVQVMELLLAFEASITKFFYDMKVLAPLIPHFCIAANPFVYNFMSKTFHKHLKETVGCLRIVYSLCSRNVVEADENETYARQNETQRLQPRRGNVLTADSFLIRSQSEIHMNVLNHEFSMVCADTIDQHSV